MKSRDFLRYEKIKEHGYKIEYKKDHTDEWGVNLPFILCIPHTKSKDIEYTHHECKDFVLALYTAETFIDLKIHEL